ncbi:fluoroquinolone export ABC transporter permease subunit [Petrocella sp. FN5]|uniref:fluoroquinolone export ABC transporter permease subunit n=1 Tax=Petrocella sp. FN5 TaxID=3032002 RepID=UPI0023DBA807|nr:ABC transporter permease [Petrocella sp. FN5]MDF1616205.1 ABC transporter permease [Petrocella sp. FN5]
MIPTKPNASDAYGQRLLSALKADILFQFKQGFYFVYLILSLFYLIVFYQLDNLWLSYIMPIVLFMDPSVLGLFFIGGILLLEKEQGILSLMYVTPLRIWEYILSKVISLCFISLMAVLLISIIAYKDNVNYIYLVVGVILTSVFFTLCGFLVATRSKSVNDFFVKIIPWMMLLILPCFLLVFYPNLVVLGLIPSVASLKLVWGAYHPLSFLEFIILVLYMTSLNVILLKYTYRIFQNKMVLE